MEASQVGVFSTKAWLLLNFPKRRAPGQSLAKNFGWECRRRDFQRYMLRSLRCKLLSFHMCIMHRICSSDSHLLLWNLQHGGTRQWKNQEHFAGRESLCELVQAYLARVQPFGTHFANFDVIHSIPEPDL